MYIDIYDQRTVPVYMIYNWYNSWKHRKRDDGCSRVALIGYLGQGQGRAATAELSAEEVAEVYMQRGGGGLMGWIFSRSKKREDVRCPKRWPFVEVWTWMTCKWLTWFFVREIVDNILDGWMDEWCWKSTYIVLVIMDEWVWNKIPISLISWCLAEVSSLTEPGFSISPSPTEWVSRLQVPKESLGCFRNAQVGALQFHLT